jgi:hypothetical protein
VIVIGLPEVPALPLGIPMIAEYVGVVASLYHVQDACRAMVSPGLNREATHSVETFPSVNQGVDVLVPLFESDPTVTQLST